MQIDKKFTPIIRDNITWSYNILSVDMNGKYIKCIDGKKIYLENGKYRIK